jgi:prevent-host-death family protein
MVFVGRHDATIGRSNGRHKVENDSVEPWRRNTCCRVKAAKLRTTHVAGTTQNAIENIMEIDFTDASAPCPYGGQPPKKQCADKHLGTKFRQRGNSLYLALLFALFFGTDLELGTRPRPKSKPQMRRCQKEPFCPKWPHGSPQDSAMKTMSAREAKNAFGLMIDTARAGPVLIEKHGRGVVVVVAVEEYERLTVGQATKAKTAERDVEAARK